MERTKRELLSQEIEHIDIKKIDMRSFVRSMEHMAFSSRDLFRATHHFMRMLQDRDCTVFLGLAGSLVSAGLKQVIIDMVECNMVDAIVSTGANIVDQDFFEALGFRHYVGSKHLNDNYLRTLGIDRIYDTFIDEEQLKVCDRTIYDIAQRLAPKTLSSREFIQEMGKWIEENDKDRNSIVHTCYKKRVPIFCPAFSDCSAGFGLTLQQWKSVNKTVAIDAVRDFMELTKIKIDAFSSGIFLIGGGVPKNFIQDTVVAAEVLGYSTPMHKYAIQVTVADERDGALSGSTLKEAGSWGKVDGTYEQMVYSEATLAFPLMVSVAYHEGFWRTRKQREYAAQLDAWHASRNEVVTA